MGPLVMKVLAASGPTGSSVSADTGAAILVAGMQPNFHCTSGTED